MNVSYIHSCSTYIVQYNISDMSRNNAPQHRQRRFSISLFNVYIWHLVKNKINDEFFIIIDSFRCKKIPYKESSEMSIMPALPYQSHALSHLLDNDFRIEGPFFCHIYLNKYVKYICVESLNDFELRRCCFRK